MSETKQMILIKQGTSEEYIKQIYHDMNTTYMCGKINLCFDYSQYGDVEIDSKDGRICKSAITPDELLQKKNPSFYNDMKKITSDTLLTDDTTEIYKLTENILKIADQNDKNEESYDAIVKNINSCNDKINSNHLFRGASYEFMNEQVD